MTVYTKSMMEALAEVRDIQEDNMDLMRKAAGGAMQTIKMKDGKLKMDSFTASALMQVYDKVNPKNKKAMEQIINSGKRAQMVKLQSIAMKAIKSENDPEIEEEVELDEAKYDLYHKDFSSAMQHAYKMAKKLHGITVKSSEIDDKVASGPRKPSEGKTNKYRLEGDKGSIQVQVYNKGGSKPFELNMYKEEVELDEVAGTFTIVANGISDLKKADKQYLEDTQYSIAAGLAEDGVELDEEGVSYKGNSIIIPSDNEDMRMVQSWTKNQTKLAADTVKMIKPNMDYNDLYEERADHLYVAALLTKTAKPNRAPKYSVKFMKEEAELDEGRMKELHGYIAQGKSAEWIAKKMGVDVKTIKSLMDGYKNEGSGGISGRATDIDIQQAKRDVKLKKLKKKINEASAYADAMKAMSKGRKVDPADVDTDASDADIKAASKNILAQMRKVVSLGGRFDVEFLDKKKVRVKPAIANAFIRKYEGMRRPADKEKFQNQAMKSYKDMLKVLKAGYNEEVELDEGRFIMTPKQAEIIIDYKWDLLRSMPMLTHLELSAKEVQDLVKKHKDLKPLFGKTAMKKGTTLDRKKLSGLARSGKDKGMGTLSPKGKIEYPRGKKGGYREEVELDEWTISDVEIAMKKKYGKVDKEAIEKLKKVLYKGNVDRNDLVKVGHGKLHVESVELDEALPSHLKKHFDKDGNPKSKEGKAAWERLAKMKGFKKYTSKQIKMAVGIAFDKRFVQGNMTGAVNAIEKIAKGLSEIEPVRNALQRANENTILDRIDRKLKERKNG